MLSWKIQEYKTFPTKEPTNNF